MRINNNKISNNEPIIELENVTLEIPLYSSSDFNLKKKLIKSVTGGTFQRDSKKTSIKALDSISLTVRPGEKIDEEKSILIGASDWRKDGLAIGY